MKKKIFLISAAALILVGIFATVGYTTYLAPRQRVASFTTDLAPIANDSVQLDKKMSAYFKGLDTDWKGKPEKARQVIKDGVAMLDSASIDYQNLLDRVNAIDSPEETKELKQSYMDMFQFYITLTPEMKDYFSYLDQTLTIVTELDSSSKQMLGMKPGNQAEAEKMLSDLSGNFDGAAKKLAALHVPPGLTALNQSITSELTEGRALMDETLQAVTSLDRAKLNSLSTKMSDWEKKYKSVDPDGQWKKNFEEETHGISDKEKDLGGKIKNNISNLKAEYGSRWVPDGLNYDVDESESGNPI